MSVILKTMLICLLAYLLGCLNMAIALSKMLADGDIRKSGSGNAGATNMLRVYGIKAALPVFLADIAKGFIAVSLPRWFGIGDNGFTVLLAGLAVVAGHNWPVMHHFKGGKGVSATVGIGLALIPYPTIFIGVVIFIAALLIFGMVSLGSMLSVTSVTAYLFFAEYPFFTVLLIALLDALLLFQHIPNIIRIAKGEESNIWKKKKKSESKDNK